MKLMLPKLHASIPPTPTFITKKEKKGKESKKENATTFITTDTRATKLT